jgi:K+-transporting ATPase KdpF subunit
VSLENLTGLILAVALCVFLVIALIFPDKF